MRRGQAEVLAFIEAIDGVGNLPPLPGIFPDYPAPIVRGAPGGGHELVLARWGMPSPMFVQKQAAEKRADALRTRANLKTSQAAMHKRKSKDAERIRSEFVEDDFDEIYANITHRKKVIADKYATRFVSSEAASEWMSSPLKWLHDAARRAIGGSSSARDVRL